MADEIVEIKVKYPEEYTLDEVVDRLLICKKKGLQVYCTFNGHELHSKDISLEKAYKEVYGYDIKPMVEKQKEYVEWVKDRRSRIDEVDTESINKTKEVRQNSDRIITKESVVRGMKFIAENKGLPTQEFVDGLLARDCWFTQKDITKQFPEGIVFKQGFAEGRISAGAYIIAMARDSESSRKMIEEAYFGVEDGYTPSAYEYIRTLTNDPTYTKEYVDEINKRKKRTM